MRNLLIAAAIGALGFSGWYYVHQSKAQAFARRAAAAEETRRATAHGAARVTVDASAPPSAPREGEYRTPSPVPHVVAEPDYRCDGRIYCSQMTSCEEAQWFLDNCPGVKMDNHGKGDGVPCERQWCGNR